ncbi:Superfamily I DNA and RNA helicases and helicase subunits [Actinomycetales bacterium JB111]|nr:Superfamily I DNA and RNA helicases and helicase subunits [Actinomycetales bacterium JB111]
MRRGRETDRRREHATDASGAEPRRRWTWPGTRSPEQSLPDETAPADDVPPAPDEAEASSPRSRSGLVAAAVEDWIAELTALGADGTGTDDDLGEAILDLTSAHPGGIAQLYAGRPTRLKNLVRETHASAQAHRAARAVRARAEDLAQRFGVAPTYLATGIATWSALPPPVYSDGELEPGVDPADAPEVRGPAEPPLVTTIRTPVFLRGIRLQPVTADGEVEFTLERTIELNPVLARALVQAGMPESDVESLAFSGSASEQRAALHRVAARAGEFLPGLDVLERVVVGTFLHPGELAVEDLRTMVPHLAHSEVVAALAGDQPARDVLGIDLPEGDEEDPDPDVERAVGDLEVAGERALDLVGRGRHFLVDTPPGADDIGVAAAILARAAADGRTVTYVPGDRRTGRSTVAYLHGLGLGELVLDLRSDGGWREDASKSIRRGMEAPAVRVDETAVAQTRRALRAQRSIVRAQLGSLHNRHEGWGVSVFDALQALARLTSQTPGPRTAARISGEPLRALRGEARMSAAARLARAAALGAFVLEPGSTPWYGARLTTNAEAADALERVQRLDDLELPAVADLVETTGNQTGLHEAGTLREWREQLTMLDGIADALDVFLPQIFEHSAADMVAATAPRQDRRSQEIEMSGATRRRLVRQARDLVRPGRSVVDLHGELLRVQDQREIWQRHSRGGSWPKLPDGLSDIRELERETTEDVGRLDLVLGSGIGRPALEDLPLPELRETVAALAADTTALRTLPERTRLVEELRADGLGDLLDDLSARRVGDDLVGPELDLAWWSSVLEQVLADESALSDRDPLALAHELDELERLEAAQRETLVPAVRAAVADRLRAAVRTHRTQAAHLWQQLADDRGATIARALAEHPDVAPTIRPVRAAAPLLASQILNPGDPVDLAVLHGVEHLPLAQLISILGRARQVVVIGDVRRDPSGAARALAEVLPAVSLPAVRGPLVPGAARILAAHGYADTVAPVPAARADEGVVLDLVDGFGTPAPGLEIVESVDSEVRRVVEVVRAEVHGDSGRSIAVVTPSVTHASRVRDALAKAAATDPALEAAHDARLVEPLIATDLSDAAGLRRDVLVFSVGFGANAHGRFAHRFGDLSSDDGRTRMATALALPRHRLVVVSTIAPGSIDRGRIHHEGAHMLADLLDLASGTDPFAEGAYGRPGEDEGADDAPARVATADDQSGHDGAPAHDVPAGEVEPNPADETEPAPVGESESAEQDAAADGTGTYGAGDPAEAQSDAEAEGDVARDGLSETEDEFEPVDGSEGAAEPLPAATSDEALAVFEGESAGDVEPVATAEHEAAVEEPTGDVEPPHWLRGVDAGPAAPASQAAHEADGSARDDIVADLVDRLRNLGLIVEEDVHGAVDVPIALAHPDLPDTRLVAVLTDAGEDAGERSLRRRLDRAAVLARAGWRVERTFTVALFLDPQAEADRIHRVVLDEVAARRNGR